MAYKWLFHNRKSNNLFTIPINNQYTRKPTNTLINANPLDLNMVPIYATMQEKADKKSIQLYKALRDLADLIEKKIVLNIIGD